MAVNAEARQEAIPEVPPPWQDEVINGVYPLLRRLEESGHSTLFLTECQAQDAPVAAIKIVPIERVTLAQLARWRTASELSHPHLIRLFDAGLCQLGGRQFLFVVMEYAEQTLAQVLLQRSLTAAEVRDMLPAILDALDFLHGQGLVQGRLKPTNVLVVGDQLKLASDGVCPSGEGGSAIDGPSPYDAPEARGGALTAASDIWSLGITLIEALTQRLPDWADGQHEHAMLAPGLAPAFAEWVQRCLSRDPDARPSLDDLRSSLTEVPNTAAAVSVPPSAAAAPETPHAPAVDLPAPLPRPRQRVSAIAVALVLLIVCWGGLRMLQSPVGVSPGAAISTAPQAGGTPTAVLPQPPPAAVSVVPTPSANPAPAEPSAASPGAAHRSDLPQRAATQGTPSVVHEEIPHAPQSALQTIHGHVRVGVQVTVDPSGNVIDASVENPGPSWYFARLAREAARKWKFVPAEAQHAREWHLKFEFSPRGATAQASPP